MKKTLTAGAIAKRTKQVPRTARYRNARMPTLDNVGVLMTMDEDGTAIFMYVPRTHASWARVVAHIDVLPVVLDARMYVFNSLYEYIRTGRCYIHGSDAEAVCRTLIGEAERVAWKVKSNVPACREPRFTNSDVIVLPSWT